MLGIGHLARRILHPSILRFAAPYRTVRQLFQRQPDRISLAEARRILVIRPDEIGDAILTIPFLRTLRTAAPLAEVSLLVKDACYELFEQCPYINYVYKLSFDRKGSHRYRLRLCLSALRLRWTRMGLRGFDLVLLPRRDQDWYDSLLIGHLLAGRGVIWMHKFGDHRTIGNSSSKSQVQFKGWHNSRLEHEVLHNLRFVESLGSSNHSTSTRLEVWFSPTDRQFASRLLSPDKLYAAFAAGSGDAARCWPVQRFAAIASWLKKEFGLASILLGTRNEPSFAADLNLLGQTTLNQAAAVIERCSVFIGNDSGLKHVAAAVGRPVVEVSGFRRGADTGHGNSPERFQACGVLHQVVQAPSGNGVLAIEEVTEQAVREACVDLFSRVPLVSARGCR